MPSSTIWLSYFCESVRVSCAAATSFSATHVARARRGAAQLPSPRAPWLFAGNYAASRCLRRSYPLIGPPATCSRHGADFRGVHAAHPAATLTSAQFFYANQSHKIQRLNSVHCYFGANVSVCAKSGLSRPMSGACCNGYRKNRG